MFDAASPSERSTDQRARGALHVALRTRGGETVLDRLRQDGCLKARLPRAEIRGWANVVMLNSSGGIAGGDRIETRLEMGPGAQASFSSQAAERFYRVLPEQTARVRTSIRLDAARIDWLPQETILFDGCAIDRELSVEMSGNSAFLGLETLVFGRAAMGETIRHGSVRDLIRLRRDGRLVLHDAIRLAGPIADLLDRAAVANGGRVVTTIVFAAPDCASCLDRLRDALSPFDAGASTWDGVLVARIVSANMACQRDAIVAGLGVLRNGRPVPRVWQC